MYEIWADDLLIYSDVTPLETVKVVSPKLTLADSAAGQLEMSLPPINVGYDVIKRMVTDITVKCDGEWLWSGRVLQDSYDFWNNRKMVCEGEIAFLNDSIQPPAKYEATGDNPTTISSFLIALIDQHNSQVGANRQFEVGDVTVTDGDMQDDDDAINRYTNYETTLECINDKLLKRLKGHLRVRHANGKRILDYISDDSLTTNSQVVRFGVNLLDFSKNIDMSELSTVIVPRGHRLEDDSDVEIEGLEPYLTVKSLDQNLDDEGNVTTDPKNTWHDASSLFVKNPTAVNNFGWICAVVDWDAVTVVENLYSKAVKYLKDEQYEKMTLEVKAVDLKYMDYDAQSIKFLSKLRCISEPHGMDHTFIVSKLEIDLSNPGNSTYTLGTDVKLSLTQATSRVNSEVQAQIDKLPSKSEMLRAAEHNAYMIISGAENSYVHFIPGIDANGKQKGIQRIEVTDGPTYNPDADHDDSVTTDPFPDSLNRWIWTVGGLGHIGRERYEDPWENIAAMDVALQMNGAIVADMITAGKMNCDILDGGEIKGQKITGSTLFEMLAQGSSYDTTLNWGSTWGDSLTVVSNQNRDGGLGVCQKGHKYDRAVYMHYNDIRLYDQNYNPQYAEFDYPSSDVRLKDNIEDINPELFREFFKRIRPVSFDYKNGVKEQVGLVAQELIEILDDLEMNKDDIIGIDEEEFYTIKYNRLTRFAMLALHDIYSQIEELKKK